jgi:hypothetical protein
MKKIMLILVLSLFAGNVFAEDNQPSSAEKIERIFLCQTPKDASGSALLGARYEISCSVEKNKTGLTNQECSLVEFVVGPNSGNGSATKFDRVNDAEKGRKAIFHDFLDNVIYVDFKLGAAILNLKILNEIGDDVPRVEHFSSICGLSHGV